MLKYYSEIGGIALNIILIGMPGAGKSTVGVVLAKALGYDFSDSDLIIQRETGKRLCEIIDEIGTDGFIETENRIVSGIRAQKTVIATGGSVVYGRQAMENLKKDGIAVYLKVCPDELKRRLGNITTRGIAMKKGESIEQLCAERAPLYEKYADIVADTSGLSLEETVAEIISRLPAAGF